MIGHGQELGEDIRDSELGAALRGAAEALAGKQARSAGAALPGAAISARGGSPRFPRALWRRAVPVAAALVITAAASITGLGLSRRAAIESASLDLARLLLPTEDAWLYRALAPSESESDELLAFLQDLWDADPSGTGSASDF